MKGNMNQLLKQVQQMQSKLTGMQDKMADETAEGQAGGGMVKATVNGKQELLKVELERDVVDPEDIEMLQDLIVAAVNAAMKNMQDRMNSEMGKITGGMKIPGMF